MKLTSNYSLKKPDGSDVVNIQDINDNSDKIDLELKKVEASLKDCANKVDNIRIADGTTTQKGIVQLNNTTNSTSQTEAATANIVRLVNYAAQEADEKAREAHVKARNAQETADAAQKKAEEAFQYASNGKSAIANAITGKGIGTNTNETFQQLANKISQISAKNRVLEGIVKPDSNNSVTINNIPFTPSFAIVTISGHYSSSYDFYLIAVYEKDMFLTRTIRNSVGSSIGNQNTIQGMYSEKSQQKDKEGGSFNFYKTSTFLNGTLKFNLNAPEYESLKDFTASYVILE